MRDIFKSASPSNISTRQAYRPLIQPLCKTNMGLYMVFKGSPGFKVPPLEQQIPHLCFPHDWILKSPISSNLPLSALTLHVLLWNNHIMS